MVTWTFSPPSRIFVSLISFENWKAHRVWKPPSENWSYPSFLVCSSDLGRLQNKTWTEKQCKFCDISEYILLKSGYILKNNFHSVFQKYFKDFAFFKSGINRKVNPAARLVQTCMQLIMSVNTHTGTTESITSKRCSTASFLNRKSAVLVV